MRKLLLIALLVFGVAACDGAATDTPGGDDGVDMEDPAHKGSYAQGYQIGLQGQDLPIETDPFLAGIRDGLSGEGELDQEQLQAALAEFNQMMVEAHESKAADNLSAGEEFLAENAGREEVQVTESGLQYEVLEEADGPRPAAEDVVKVHYVGTLLDGTEFDSSRGGDGEPVTFPLNRVIPGWTEGVQLMPVGSTYKFWIPGPLAYGENPQPGGEIGPNETLVFEVELLEIVEDPGQQQQQQQ